MRDELDPLLRRVRRLLPKVSRKRPGRPDTLHRLRVACRRATAASKLGPSTESTQQRRLRRALRKIRRTTSPARDLDVLMQELAGDARAAAVQPLLQRRRRKIQARLRRLRRLLAELRLQPQREEVDGGAGNRVEGNGVVSLHAADLRRLVDWRAQNPSSRALHRHRIACKRLRYRLELAQSGLKSRAAATAARDLIEILTRAQGELGAITDGVQAARQLRRLQPMARGRRQRKKLRRLAREFRDRSRQACINFTAGWQQHVVPELSQLAEDLGDA